MLSLKVIQLSVQSVPSPQLTSCPVLILPVLRSACLVMSSLAWFMVSWFSSVLNYRPVCLWFQPSSIR